MAQVDSAVANVELMDGSCNAGEALYQCGTKLFDDDTAGRAHVLIVLMAGEAAQEVSSSAGALKTAGIKIIAVGMGDSFDKSQLSAMAFSPSYVLTAASFNGLPGIGESVSTIVSQGTYNVIPSYFSRSFSGKFHTLHENFPNLALTGEHQLMAT